MQYYDQEESRKPEKKTQNMWFVSFVSSMFGGLVAIFLIPVLSNLGVLPYQLYEPAQNVAVVRDGQIESPSPEAVTVSTTVSSSIIDAVENVSPAIVGVVNVQQGHHFFTRGTEHYEAGTGSGVIFQKEDGKAYIVTNSHVIEGAEQVEVVLKDTNRVSAEVIGDDPLTDLAVLRIDDTYVTHVATFGNSENLKVGETVIAIGNPLGLEFSHTVTQGIISATERSVSTSGSSGQWDLTVIQTDAAINPGNSGGALVNTAGQVIGINSLKISHSQVEGLGFAIPSNDTIPIIEELMEHGEIERPFLGIQMMDLNEVPQNHREQMFGLQQEGVVIAHVVEGSPAHQAQLQEGDLVVEINGVTISNSQSLRRFLYTEVKMGDKLNLKVYREGEELSLQLQLSEGR